MKIAIVLCSKFNILSPFTRAVGGSESAVCYLAMELAKLGHQITLVSQCDQNIHAFGIRCLPLSIQGQNIEYPECLIKENFDAIIIKNGLPQLGPHLKQHQQHQARLFFWTGHAHNQPPIQAISNPDIAQSFDQIICVSDWQKQQFCQHFGLAPTHIQVIRNAISPFFENLFLDRQELEEAKACPPHLTYTSTPFRGLNLLLTQFPDLAKQIPALGLSVYSSMKVYGLDSEDQKFKQLYEMAHQTPNVHYFGSIGQFELASKLRHHHILAYPNTFPETSCIAVMEAMAAGLKVITTNLGALPETTLGLGELVEFNQLSSEGTAGFSAHINQACQTYSTPQTIDMLYQQVKLMNQEHTWRNRARHWLTLLNMSMQGKKQVA